MRIRRRASLLRKPQQQHLQTTLHPFVVERLFGILAGVVIGGGQGREKLLKGCNGVGRQLGRHVELLMCTVWFSRDVVEGGGWRGVVAAMEVGRVVGSFCG